MNIIKRKSDKKQADKLAKQYKVSSDIISFLLGRNVPEDVIPLLISSEEHELMPHDSLKNIPEATDVINKYLVNDNATIYIFGDYDSDGVNATYIMYTGLVELAEALESKVEIHYYLPNREEGYGLSMDWCKSIVDGRDIVNDTLVITVDNGITKVEEVEYLGLHGIETIITDHHQPQEYVPDCIIVDAHLNDTRSTNACGLCGAAVAFKVIAHLYQNVYDYDTMYIKKYVAHVGIATITDMMPFTKENVIFVSNTLKYLNDFPYEGHDYCPVVESLYYYAEANKGNKIKAKDIAFGLGPQINSCGRMGNIDIAMNFMKATDEEELEDRYIQMDNMNTERKQKTLLLSTMIEEPASTDLAIVIKLENCEGIAGAVASNLCDKYGMPTIVFNDSDNIISGSARAPEGYSLMDLFNATGCQFEAGGHEQAAGISIRNENFETFKKAFNKAVATTPVATCLSNDIYVDEIITESDINKYKINQYDKVLFFNEFTRPVYGLENIQITGYHTSKNNPNNICFHIKNKSKEVKVWCWGFTNTYKALGEPTMVNLVGSLELFNNMIVIDIVNMEAVQ